MLQSRDYLSQEIPGRRWSSPGPELADAFRPRPQLPELVYWPPQVGSSLILIHADIPKTSGKFC